MKPEAIENMSLRDLAALNGLNSQLDDMLRRLTISTHEEFVESVEIDLERIIRGLESGAAVREEDGEDRLTEEIINCLCQLSYIAAHDENYNGHSDVVVRWKQKEFVWIGEAKIHSGYDYLWDGFLQLTTRYSTGTNSCNHGGMLVYIRNVDANSVVHRWNEELNTRAFDDGEKVAAHVDSKNSLRLTSTHKHKKSGLPYVTRHFGVVLHVGPEDKSARNRKAK
ncbi:hypothetical protein RDV84_23830 [Lysobacter yananisis]|uniref:Restriction endonuclease n=1 Tax=Lysobacter yananisis TaxID=1003114 RepID=A0ABY9P7T5_9GAMM|nr:hypothetical protein [Lysobacter yananisis]WMT02956.1 hypothetical protein RDV84_23830 [Lysobacter yananisis]